MKSVLVLLSSYNGERFIQEQVDSVLAQKNINVSILIRDDGSHDNTLEILSKYSSENIKLLEHNDNLGPARSFLYLMRNCSKNYDFYAFCDQDDVWDSEKLYRAICNIESFPNNDNGRLYISALKIVDEKLNVMTSTKLLDTPNANPALVRNQATGCTMVFDGKFKELFTKYNIENVPMHDSFLYRFASIHNTTIYIDNCSYINYRQHTNNVLGMPTNKINVLRLMLKRFMNSSSDVAESARILLKTIEKENINYDYLNSIANYRTLKNKWKLLTKYRIKSNYPHSNFNYLAKVIFNRL